MPIRQLAPGVAAKIAAGEVVERPASVVKELIENSIDAGATQIRVDLAHGGLQLIRVTDNGSGIPIEELPLALARHATSKVAQIDDLERIHTLGFRGEALASIAAVADVTLLSLAREAVQGAQISANDGVISDVTTAASPIGTTLTVRNLFSAVPARLKFLKSRNTEVSHCNHLLEQYALAYPEIRFSAFSDGRQLFATKGDGQLFSVLVELYGLQIAEQMVAINGEGRADDPGYPTVNGYVSRPTCYKSTRQHISFFVNRRWVLSRLLTSAVEGAYHSLLLTGRHPIAVVNIQLDPSLLDVNVHPAKTEIRFLQERRVYASVLRAVRAALLEEPEMPQWQPRQSSAAPTAPSVQEQEDDDLGISLDEPEEDAAGEPTTASDPASQSIQGTLELVRDNPWQTVTEEETGSKPPIPARLWQSHIHSLPAKKTSVASEDAENAINRTVPASQAADAPDENAVFSVPRSVVQNTASSPGSLTTETFFTGHTIDPQQTRRLPHLRVVGQLAQSYIVTEGEDGMYLIDQHAAHERIVLERMVAALKTRAPISQLLLTPIEIELAPKEIEAIEEHLPQLEHIGFSLSTTEHSTLLVQAVPGVLVKQMSARSLHELLLDLTGPESLGDTETWEERALANVACKAAIKANYFLTVSEMREMLEQLEQTMAPYSCCHGRPTTVHFSLAALRREFDRR